ncbi:MAG: hypothetical protein J5709_08380 [Bacteroidales bacterium]|nr:hypothetical protein [Bacteroidales bacterium]
MERQNDIISLLTVKRFNVRLMTAYLQNNKQRIGDFVVYSLENEAFSWRASWVLCKYAEKNAADIQPYAQMIAENLPNITKHGHIRETLKILCHLQLDEKHTCDILDFCFRCVKNNKLQSSTKSAAFDFILKVGQSYPELQSEAQAIFSDTKDYYPHGIRKSISVKTMRASSLSNNEKIISLC